MPRDGATYGHFCLLARALERLGDRWTLLVVRDLSNGPRRFTDLQQRLGGITPKTLTTRLRELETAGLVEAERVEGRREVWYRLTPAGAELRPVLDQLIAWGLRHAVRPPEPGESAHPEHLLWALQVQLQEHEVVLPPVRWRVKLLDGGSYTLSNHRGHWEVSEDLDDEADVTLTTTRAGLTAFLTTPPPRRDPAHAGVDLAGSRGAITTLLKALAVFPLGPQPAAGS
jgi:DNA-binding HxlR family transcriptional regulator